MADTLHKDLVGTDIHEPKDISLSSNGEVYIADGLGSGAWGKNAPLNEVIINSISDFPTPSGGVITLAPGTSYVLGASISTSDAFVVGNGSSITSNNPFSPTLTYTGTGSMFTGVDVNFNFHDIRLNCSNAQIFNFSETGPGGLGFILINTVLVEICAKAGTFNNVGVLETSSTVILNCTDGITFQGSSTLAITLRNLSLESTSTSYIGLDFGTSVQEMVEITGFVPVGGAGSIGISGLATSGNIKSNFISVVSNGNFNGVTTPLSGIDSNDVRWRFRDNSEITNTKTAAFSSMISNTTVTTIASAGVPVKIAGTFTEQLAAAFTTDSSGRITYIGEQDLTISIDIVISGEIAVGTDDVTVFLALNGTAIAGSAHQQEFTSGDPNNLTTIWMLTLTPNDFLEIFIQNNDTTEDITVLDAKFRGN